MAFHTFTLTAVALASCQGAHAAGPLFTTDADPFLGRDVASRSGVVEDMMTALQNSSIQHGGEKIVEDDLSKVAELLRPTYSVLPKNKHDRLSSAAVRYLLHRHFLHHRAWLVTGLAPDGQAWDAPFPMGTLTSWAPDAMQTVVADHLNGRGLTLQECAVLATMLENRVHAEAIDVLRIVWKAHANASQDAVAPSAMHSIVEDFVLAYLDGAYLTNLKKHDSPHFLQHQRREIIDGYPGWSATEPFLVEMQEYVSWGHALDGTMGFGTGEQIVMRVIQNWGKYHQGECRSLKSALLNMESKRPGRVELNVFHGSAINGQVKDFFFDESTDYLRDLGILDESVPSQPAVVIPNYVSCPSNYIASGNFFAVTCTDECEDLLSAIERSIGEPYAKPEEIALVTKSLPSLDGDRADLSEAMMEKLHQVAALHGGRVPLHGRLFALWMHHAYPRDCPHPGQSGVSKQLFPEEYEETTGQQSVESKEEIYQELREFKEEAAMHLSEDALGAVPLPWDLNEEILAEHVAPRSSMVIGMAFAAVSATLSAGVAAYQLQLRDMPSSLTKAVV